MQCRASGHATKSRHRMYDMMATRNATRQQLRFSCLRLHCPCGGYGVKKQTPNLVLHDLRRSCGTNKHKTRKAPMATATRNKGVGTSSPIAVVSISPGSAEGSGSGMRCPLTTPSPCVALVRPRGAIAGEGGAAQGAPRGGGARPLMWQAAGKS